MEVSASPKEAGALNNSGLRRTRSSASFLSRASLFTLARSSCASCAASNLSRDASTRR